MVGFLIVNVRCAGKFVVFAECFYCLRREFLMFPGELLSFELSPFAFVDLPRQFSPTLECKDAEGVSCPRGWDAQGSSCLGS